MCSLWAYCAMTAEKPLGLINLSGGLKVRKVKKPVFFIVLLCIIAFGYLTYAGIHTQYGDIKTSYIKGVEDIRWGIDIQGGVNATFEPADNRSEERRVGKECRSRWSPYH